MGDTEFFSQKAAIFMERIEKQMELQNLIRAQVLILKYNNTNNCNEWIEPEIFHRILKLRTIESQKPAKIEEIIGKAEAFAERTAKLGGNENEKQNND